MKYRSVRGTHDLIGSEIYKFDKIIIEISKLGQIFNFQKIETPIFEFTELFSKPLGEQILTLTPNIDPQIINEFATLLPSPI